MRKRDQMRLAAALVRKAGSQVKAAELIGVSQPTISRWMNGTSPMPIMAQRIARSVIGNRA